MLITADFSYDYKMSPGTTFESCQVPLETYLLEAKKCLQQNTHSFSDALSTINAVPILCPSRTVLPEICRSTPPVESYTALLEFEEIASATLLDVTPEQLEGLCSRELKKKAAPKPKPVIAQEKQLASNFSTGENFSLFFLRGFVTEACKRRRIAKPGEWAIRTTCYVGLLNYNGHSFQEIAGIIALFSLMDAVQDLI